MIEPRSHQAATRYGLLVFMPKKRNRFIGAILSFYSPGLGQLYRGEPKKAFGIALGLLIIFTLGYLFLFASGTGLAAFCVLFFGLFLWNLWDAFSNSGDEITLRWFNRWYIYLSWFLIFGLLAGLLRYEARFQAFKIPSDSMIPALRIGDHIMVSKQSYNERAPSRGDVVVFNRNDNIETPEDESRINIVRRIIGLPGDEVRVDGADVFINNQILSEPYANWSEGGISDINFGPQKVPPGHLFMLGDNRDHSRDSRFWPEVFIPVHNVFGKVLYICWSWDDFERIGQRIL